MSEDNLAALIHRIAAEHIRDHEIRFTHQGIALGFAALCLGMFVLAIFRGL